MANGPALLAAIPFSQDHAVDRLLERVVAVLVAGNHRVAGFLQFAAGNDEGCCGAVEVEDIETGDRYQIMQPLGRHSKGCRLDPQAMASVSARALKSLENRPDILVLNRFGKGESDGQGLRSVFEAAVVSGIPVLTSVKETYLPSWLEFAEDLSVTLERDEDEIVAWCLRVIENARELYDAA